MGDLPGKEHPTENPGTGIEPAGGGGPAHHRRDGTADRADHGVERGPDLERSVDEDIDDDDEEREHGGEPIGADGEDQKTDERGHDTPGRGD